MALLISSRKGAPLPIFSARPANFVIPSGASRHFFPRKSRLFDFRVGTRSRGLPAAGRDLSSSLSKTEDLNRAISNLKLFLLRPEALCRQILVAAHCDVGPPGCLKPLSSPASPPDSHFGNARFPLTRDALCGILVVPLKLIIIVVCPLTGTPAQNVCLHTIR